MKRSTLLSRVTPLRRGASLERHTPLAEHRPAGKPLPDTAITPEVRLLVLERDGYACVCCGVSIKGRRYSLGHRKRRSHGGHGTPDNLITLLGWGGEACHGRIDLYKDPADADKGYRLRSRQNPADVPVTVWTPDGPARVWLRPDGSRKTYPPRQVAA